MNQITVARLSKQFKSVTALRGVSTVFEGGKIHGVIGPNGAGKTTLIRLLTGLLSPTEGEIIYDFDGEKRKFSEVKDITGYFPQEPSLYPDLSCKEHLEFFRDLYVIPQKDFEERAKTLLEATGLTEFLDRPAGKLSGGMYKKLGLMCVLLNRPKVLLLDEPTIGVDPISRRDLWNLLNSFSAAAMTVIISTSYMEEALKCAKVHVLSDGKLLRAGEPSQMMKELNLKKFEEVFFYERDNKS